MAGGSQKWWQIIPGLFGVLLGVGVFYFSPTPAPSMINGWREISLTQEQCVQRAEAALKAQGFSRRFEIVGGNSVYGEQRTLVTALIRCVAAKGLVTTWLPVAISSTTGPGSMPSVRSSMP